MKILGVSGTIAGSKTGVVIREILKEIHSISPICETKMLDLKQYDIQFCDGRPPSEYEGDTKKAIDLIGECDAYIFGTPIFNGSMSGALKNLFDLVPPEQFNEKVIGFAATGGKREHYLVIENQLKPIASYCGAYVAPAIVFADGKQFNENNEIIDGSLIDSIRTFAQQFVKMALNLNQAEQEIS